MSKVKLPLFLKVLFVLILVSVITLSSSGVDYRYQIGVEQARAATFNFSENFSTGQYKDTGNTTADWNTSTQSLKLLGSSGFYKADGSTTGTNNISTETGINGTDNVRAQSWDSIVLDSNGNPHIAWKEQRVSTTVYDIYYSQWSGSAWVKADGTTAGADQVTSPANTPGFACSAGPSCDYHDPSLKLDSQDRPMIAFHSDQSGYQTIGFSRWNGSAWTHADGTTAGFEEYVEDQNYNRGSPAYEYDREASLAVTGDDRPAIAWMDETSQDIWYREYSTVQSAWVAADGSTTGCYTGLISACRVGTGTGNAGRPSLALNSGDEPEIAWTTRGGSAQIKFARYNSSTGNWVTAAGTVGDDTPTTITPAVQPVLRLDSSNNPHVSFYLNDTGGSIFKIYYTKWNGSAWVNVAGGAGATDVSTAVGSGTSDYHQNMVLDNAGRPALAWLNTTGNSDINYSHYNGTSWVKADGSTSGYDVLAHTGLDDTADFPSIALDSSNSPYIVYSDAPTSSGSVARDVFLTRWRSFASPGIGQSLAVDVAAGNITDATLTATLAAGSPSFFMSNDGGSTFEAVSSGVLHTFGSTGADLRWKASLTGTDEVTNINISYTSSTATTSAGPVTITATVSEQITCSLLNNNVYFGTISNQNTRYGTAALGGSGTNNRISTLSSSSNAGSGYIWTVKGNDLSSGSDAIEAIGPTAATSQTNVDQFGINTGLVVDPGGSSTITIDPQYADTSTPKYALAKTTDTIIDVNGPSGTAQFDLEWMANRSAATTAGTYTAINTFICTGRF